MKIEILISALLVGVLASPSARGGADTSGGGKGVVCRDQANHILSVEMLDLYEARALFGLTPLSMGDTLDQTLAMAKSKFVNTVFDAAYTIPPALDQLRQKIHITPPGSHLEPIDDADPILHLDGCKLEQAAAWIDSGLVVADGELWAAMDARNQAALLAHEVIYARTRAEGEKNSRRARNIVGHVFSRFDFTGTRDGLPATPRTLCISGSAKARTNSEFWIYPDEKGQLVTQFEILHDSWLYDKTTAAFTTIPFDAKKQKIFGMEVCELVSNFEGGKIFTIFSRLDEKGERQLSTTELDDKGEEVDVPISCYEQT